MLAIKSLKNKSLKIVRQEVLWKLGVLVLIVSVTFGIALYGYSRALHPVNPAAIDPTTQVLSKEAVNELIKKAAEKRYLDDVFNSSARLPTHKQALHPASPEPIPVTSNHATSSSASVERCHYSGESYVPGDILKTAQGWVRCVPTLIFQSDKESSAGNPVWIAVQ